MGVLFVNVNVNTIRIHREEQAPSSGTCKGMSSESAKRINLKRKENFKKPNIRSEQLRLSHTSMWQPFRLPGDTEGNAKRSVAN